MFYDAYCMEWCIAASVLWKFFLHRAEVFCFVFFSFKSKLAFNGSRFFFLNHNVSKSVFVFLVKTVKVTWSLASFSPTARIRVGGCYDGSQSTMVTIILQNEMGHARSKKGIKVRLDLVQEKNIFNTIQIHSYPMYLTYFINIILKKQHNLICECFQFWSVWVSVVRKCGQYSSIFKILCDTTISGKHVICDNTGEGRNSTIWDE